jgi:hypothetical protein
MTEMHGTIPPANDRYHADEHDRVSHRFDRRKEVKEVLEKRGAPPSFLSVVWPFLIGSALAYVAPRILDLLTQPQLHLDWLVRAVFPYVLITSRPEFRLYGPYTSQLPKFILLAQFPLEGLLTMYNLRHRMKLGVAIGMLIVIHLVGAFVLFLLTQY